MESGTHFFFPRPGNLYEMFYAGLDCAKFTENVLKVGKYAGPDPCAGKASDYYFKGLEASLLGRVPPKT